MLTQPTYAALLNPFQHHTWFILRTLFPFSVLTVLSVTFVHAILIEV